jgi:hypothetical protein
VPIQRDGVTVRLDVLTSLPRRQPRYLMSQSEPKIEGFCVPTSRRVALTLRGQFFLQSRVLAKCLSQRTSLDSDRAAACAVGSKRVVLSSSPNPRDLISRSSRVAVTAERHGPDRQIRQLCIYLVRLRLRGPYVDASNRGRRTCEWSCGPTLSVARSPRPKGLAGANPKT